MVGGFVPVQTTRFLSLIIFLVLSMTTIWMLIYW
jgi:hypothetical protein